MLRTFIVALFVVLFLILCTLLYGITWLIGKIDLKKATDIEFRTVQWAFRAVMFLSGVRATYLGTENIPDGPVLYAANHRGIFDIVATHGRLPHETGYIAKDSLKKVPLLSFIMQRIFCLFLNRKDSMQGAKTIIRSFDYMKKGVSIFIFPEGTRSKSEDPAQLGMFHNGSFKAAQRLHCPVVPVAILGAEQIFEAHLPIVKAGRMVIHFGKPVLYEDLTAEQKKNIGDTFADVIRSMIKEDLPLLKAD